VLYPLLEAFGHGDASPRGGVSTQMHLMASIDGPIISLLAGPKRFDVPFTGLIEIINDPG